MRKYFTHWCFAEHNHVFVLSPLRPSDAYMCQWYKASLVKIMACCMIKYSARLSAQHTCYVLIECWLHGGNKGDISIHICIVCSSRCFGSSDSYNVIPSTYLMFPCDYIARRHGHYTTREIGGWRHDNEPVRASCHVSIRQSPSCVIPFWTHAKCLLAFISYLPMWIKAKHIY